MESKILGASVASRKTYELVCEHLSDKDYSKEYQLLKGILGSYYDRDKSASSADPQLLSALVENSTGNRKHQDRLVTYLAECVSEGASVENVDRLIIDGKINAVGNKLAMALVNRTDTAALMDEMNALRDVATLDDLSRSDAEVLGLEDFSRVMEKKASGEGLMRVYPQALNQFLNGGVGAGHHIVIFARPEMGKTAMVLTLACGFATQGKFGIYFINEDSLEDLYSRGVSCITGAPESVVTQDMAKWLAQAEARGFGNILFVSLTPGTPAEIERFVEQYNPSWIIVDQLRNLAMKETNKTVQLDLAAQAMRNIAKKYGITVVSVTQAGDSGEGKRILTMGDIDFSNTGIPAAADVLIGIGGTYDDVEKGDRYAAICKNKRGGGHAQIPLKILGHISRYRDHTGRD